MLARRMLPWLVMGLMLLSLPTAAIAQRVINYTVDPGDSLLSIAQAYDTTVAAIMQANGLTDADFIWVGQKLQVPVGRKSTTGAVSAATTYIVKAGDQLGAIAAAYGISSEALALANGITNPNLVRVGQKLTIPRGSAATVSVTAPTSKGQTRYKVKAGDSLSQIAARFGVSLTALAAANGIASPDLVYIGMDLLIPSSVDWTSPTLYGPASRFVASIAQQRCWVYQGSRMVADWACSTGRVGFETVAGTYKVDTRMDRAYGSTWDAWLPYWLGIYYAGATENGIHGIPYHPDGSRMWEDAIGTPISYGCVVLADSNARTLYKMAYVGMPVVVQP